MTYDNSRLSLARAIASMDAETLRIRLVLALLAGDDGIVPYEKRELSEMLGITAPTLKKRLSSAGVVEDRRGRLVYSHKASADDVKILSPTIYRLLDSTSSNTNVGEKSDVVPTDEEWRLVRDHFVNRHVERYGKKPWIDHRLAKNTINVFLRKYGDDAYAIIDAAFENYDAVWGTAQFPSPAFGAMFGWLGDKAYLYVDKRETTPQTKKDVKEWL